MRAARFEEITARYATLSVGILGDFCLDRYLEIDPTKEEVSIETNLAVHNVVRVRSQPGGAGTILNNLAALGVGKIFPVGFAGCDGEGWELRESLRARRGVVLDHFASSEERRTFTYCKPLIMRMERPPEELNRLDSKNWTPTPLALEERLIQSIEQVANEAGALIVLDQVDLPETGVVTRKVKAALSRIALQRDSLFILGDSRRGLRDWPPVCYKMNAAELQTLTGLPPEAEISIIQARALEIARQQGRPVFISLSERGIAGAAPSGEVAHAPALPVRGPIDIVGAGDAVTANLTAALASGAHLEEALELAMAAASWVIHQLGTTGTANVNEIRGLVTSDK